MEVDLIYSSFGPHVSRATTRRGSRDRRGKLSHFKDGGLVEGLCDELLVRAEKNGPRRLDSNSSS